MNYFSKSGTVLAALYIVACVALITSQGLFGESFIALILGMPWSIALAMFEYGNTAGPVLYFLILAPLVLNAVILYLVGWLIGRFVSKA